MRLATRRDATPDGQLVVASRDLRRAAPASAVATMQQAIEQWRAVEPALKRLSDAVEDGTAPGLFELEFGSLAAPLPRAWQWLDGSAYPSHGELMQKAFNLPPLDADRPLMYQGMSDTFLAWNEDVRLPAEEDDVDFEAEFGLILGHVPMGTTPSDALAHVRLVVLINDWSLRAIAPIEMKTGFGWVQAKPPCSMAPVAVTPDELGNAWANGRIDLVMRSRLNGQRFGDVPGAEGMAHGFGDLIAHAARTRSLVAGTVIGSGTVSSSRHTEVGSSCISERRAIEMIATGGAQTRFLATGDTVRIASGFAGDSLFGEINQRVVCRPR